MDDDDDVTASSPRCRWLAGFDVAATSPVLSFARATALGYGSGGDPATCYRAFPRCPRNPDKLVHYLNNHNGGFFRFFSRDGHGSYAEPLDASRGTCVSLCTANASTLEFRDLMQIKPLESNRQVIRDLSAGRDGKPRLRVSPERKLIALERASSSSTSPF